MIQVVHTSPIDIMKWYAHRRDDTASLALDDKGLDEINRLRTGRTDELQLKGLS